MKTPRELLLDRHQSAERKLDSIRHQFLATLTEPADDKSSAFERFFECSRRLLGMPRPTWGALAAAWLVIIALQLAARDSVQKQPFALAHHRPLSETLQAVREQKRLLAELTGLTELPESEAPRFIPRPRSDRRRESIVV